MFRKLSITFLFTVAFTSIALFAATQVIAQDPYPTECDCGPQYTITTVSPYPNYQDDGIYTNAYGDTIECKDSSDNYIPCFVWELDIQGNKNAINNMTGVDFFIPIVPGYPPHKIVGGHIASVHDPCEGSGSHFNWMEGICNGFTVEVNAQAANNTQKRAMIATLGGDSGVVGFSVTTSSEVNSCVANDAGVLIGGIQGPGYAGLDPEPQIFTYTRTADGHTCEMEVILEPDFAINVINGSCTVSGPFDASEIGLTTPDHPGAGSTIDMQEGWFSFHGSPASYCYYNKKKRKTICVTY